MCGCLLGVSTFVGWRRESFCVHIFIDTYDHDINWSLRDDEHREWQARLIHRKENKRQKNIINVSISKKISLWWGEEEEAAAAARERERKEWNDFIYMVICTRFLCGEESTPPRMIENPATWAPADTQLCDDSVAYFYCRCMVMFPSAMIGKSLESYPSSVGMNNDT